MTAPQMVMYEEDVQQIQRICDRLYRDANGKVVYLIDKNGQLVAESGEIDSLDSTSLASLTAGTIAATGGIAKLLSEKEFSGQFHEGEKTHVHISLVGQRLILLVIFDHRSSLGLVRLRVKKAGDELNKVLETVLLKAQAAGTPAVFDEITDDDIDNLFK